MGISPNGTKLSVESGDRTQLKAMLGATTDFVNDYAYDALHRLTQVKQHGVTAGNAIADKRVEFVYDSLSRFDVIRRYEDLAGAEHVASSDYNFDFAGRLTSLNHSSESGMIPVNYDWTYDRANRVTSFSNEYYPDEYVNYNYDEADQLTLADYATGTDESYAYDNNGNRLNYTTGAYNRLESDGVYNYEYDNEGNWTKRTEIATGAYVEYVWDHHNRLTKLLFKSSAGALTKQVEYDYDVFGRRVAKRIDSTGDGVFETAQNFVYDGEDIVLVFDNSGVLSERYLHGPDVDQVLASEEAKHRRPVVTVRNRSWDRLVLRRA